MLANAGLYVDDIDLFEVNEAFAAVVGAWLRETGVDWDKVNVKRRRYRPRSPARGLGRSADDDLVNELERTGTRYGLQTMCEGGGTANGTILELSD